MDVRARAANPSQTILTSELQTQWEVSVLLVWHDKVRVFVPFGLAVRLRSETRSHYRETGTGIRWGALSLPIMSSLPMPLEVRRFDRCRASLWWQDAGHGGEEIMESSDDAHHYTHPWQQQQLVTLLLASELTVKASTIENLRRKKIY